MGRFITLFLAFACVAAVSVRDDLKLDAAVDAASGTSLAVTYPTVYSGGSCSSEGGVCINTRAASCEITTLRGKCPGPNAIRCCPKPKGFSWTRGSSSCSNKYKGLCKRTSTTCAGGYVTGACPGPASVKCCKPASTGGHTRPTPVTPVVPVTPVTPVPSGPFPTAGTRSCPRSKLTSVCVELGSGGTDDNTPGCSRAGGKSRGVKGHLGWVCKENNQSPRNGWDPEKNSPRPITRQEIMQRAVVWVNEGIRYSQRRYHKSSSGGNTEMAYRTDCSGFTSMAWAAGVAPSTSYMCCTKQSKLYHRISCHDLLPGDAMVTSSTGHIMLFVRWVDKAAGSLKAWEEMGHAYGTVEADHSFRKNMAGPFTADATHTLDGRKSYRCLRRNNISG